MRQQEQSPCRPELPRGQDADGNGFPDNMPAHARSGEPGTPAILGDSTVPQRLVASSDPAHRQPQQEDATRRWE